MVSTITRITVLTLLTCLTGCWSYHPSNHYVAVGKVQGPQRATWPTREIAPLEPILKATPAEFPLWAVLGDASKLNEAQKKLLETEKGTVVYKGIHGVSLLRILNLDPKPREIEYTQGGDWFDKFTSPGFPANARMFSSRTLSSAAEAEAREKSLSVPSPVRPQLPVKQSAKQNAKSALEEGAFLFQAGIAQQFNLYDGKPLRIPPIRKTGEYKGLLLHFQAIAYNDYEPKVLEEFERRGWAVIDIATESSTAAPLDPEQVARYQSLLGKANSILEQIISDQKLAFPEDKALAFDDPGFNAYSGRFYSFERTHRLYPKYLEAYTEALKHHAMSFQACTDAVLDAVASQIAERIDQALAGNAYAAETCLDYVKTQRPDLQNIPVVIAGFSAGALATPAAAALLRDDLSAVVVIGGAADLFMVAQGSSLTDGGLKVRCKDDKISPEMLAKLDALYLQHTRLDPTVTGPMIAHLPILQVHATSDTWVPAKQGELLYESLNHPDRLEISAGHELLFYFLPAKAKFIANWVEDKCGLTHQQAARH